MKDMMHKSTWDRPYTMLSWGSMVVALFCSIIFFAAYGGTAWWVEYYSRPDGQIVVEAKSFGLFRFCNRGDCAVDMGNRPLIRSFVPQEFQAAAIHALPASQWLMSFALFLIMMLFVAYIAFLVGAKTAFAEVWLQFFICILIITSVAVFGVHFRGSTPYLPYGWSYWLAVVCSVLFLVNGCFVLFVALAVRRKDQLSPMKLYVSKG
jgi:hypothetical protein